MSSRSIRPYQTCIKVSSSWKGFRFHDAKREEIGLAVSAHPSSMPLFEQIRYALLTAPREMVLKELAAAAAVLVARKNSAPKTALWPFEAKGYAK